MKKFILLIALFACFTACDDESEEVTPEGEQTTIENGNFDVFSKLDLLITADIQISQGDEMNVKFIGDQEIIDKISTEVVDKKWNVKFKTQENLTYDSLKIEITLPLLEEVKITGTGDVTMKNYPKAEDMKINITGVGDFNAYDMEVKKYSVNLPGVGNCYIHASETLDVTIPGVGKVYYKGSPKITETIKGVGEVIDAN
jgi:hypothetical protein